LHSSFGSRAHRWNVGRLEVVLMHDSQRYGRNAVDCMGAARRAHEPHYQGLYLLMAQTRLSLVEQHKATDRSRATLTRLSLAGNKMDEPCNASSRSRESSLIMDAPISTPAFEARRLSSASGWYVRAAWPNGKRDHIPGFVSQKNSSVVVDAATFGRLRTAS